jgi:hypothetical protein
MASTARVSANQGAMTAGWTPSNLKGRAVEELLGEKCEFVVAGSEPYQADHLPRQVRNKHQDTNKIPPKLAHGFTTWHIVCGSERRELSCTSISTTCKFHPGQCWIRQCPYPTGESIHQKSTMQHNTLTQLPMLDGSSRRLLLPALKRVS